MLTHCWRALTNVCPLILRPWQREITFSENLLSAEKMQVKWGICSAAKVSNDFCVALTTLPAEEHKIQGRVQFFEKN